MSEPAAYAEPVSGPAHGRPQRTVAAVLVAAAVIGLLRLELGGGAVGALGIATIIVLLAGGWFVVTSTTTIDAQGIVQSGLPERRVRWDEIEYATHGRFALLPSLRRLRVRTTRGRRLAFAGATPQLQAAFTRIGTAFPPPQP